MGSRKVAYIATIDKMEKIEGKDRIKYASLKNLGWKVIASADLAENKKVVYIEYDSIVKEGPAWAEFLRKRCYSQKYGGFKIAAMKMAGVISYGLILTFQEAGLDHSFSNLEDGYDLGEVLGVIPIDDAEEVESTQKQPPMSKFQRFIKKYLYFIWKAFYYRKPESNAFPSDGINKSDSTRIQNLSYLFNKEFVNTPLYVTEKVDGSSAAFVFKNGRFKISSRNVCQYNQQIKKAIKEINPYNCDTLGKNNKFIEIACRYSIAEALNNYSKYILRSSLSIQGELAGPAIQGNKLKLEKTDLFVFNLFDPETRQYYSWNRLADFCKISRIPHVPLKEFTTFRWGSLEELEEYVKEPMSNSLYLEGFPREGLVFRKYDDTSEYLPGPLKNMSNMWDFKVINPDYIL